MSIQKPILQPATGERRPSAPGRLELLRAFVNTVDIEAGVDDLVSPTALAEWLAARGLLPACHRLDADDLAEAIELRETLRAVLESHTGQPLPAATRRRLDRIAARAAVRIAFNGEPRLEGSDEGMSGAIGSLLGIAYDAMAAGTWERLKVCGSDTCRWAFYDSSRNRSGAWCSMAVCGNRMKGRAFRRRHAADATAAG